MKLQRIAAIVFIAFALLPSVILPSNTVHADEDGVEYWAVIIGVSDYLYSDGFYITDLYYSDDDATALYQQLVPILGSDHINLLTNSNAGKGAIQNSIQNWLAQREDSDDIVLFFFSGHGGEYGGDYYISPYDALTSSYSNDISDEELSSWLSILDSNNVLAILDTCDAGGFITGLSSNAQCIMASCTSDEYSYDSGSLQHGAFTYYLLQALDTANEVDTNEDYMFTTQEWFNYVSPNVIQFEAQFGNSQHPVNYDSYSGGLPLFVRVTVGSNIAYSSISIDGALHADGTNLLMPNIYHQITAKSEIPGGTNTRYVFLSWNDGVTTPTRTISQGGQYNANYKTQYYFTIAPILSPREGMGWYDDGATASTGIAQEIITEGDIRHVFQQWKLDGIAVEGNSITLSMHSPHTAYASYKTQYYLDIQSKYGTIYGEGWYDSEAAVQVSAPSVVGTLIRHKFNGWSGSSYDDSTTTSIYMDQPKSMVATWKTDYLYLYLLIAGAIGIALAVTVPVTIHIRNNKLRKRAAKKRSLQRRKQANSY